MSSSIIVFLFVFILAIYPAILFRIFLLGSVLLKTFLFSSNVLLKDSSDFSINCLAVLFTNFGFILPMIMGINLGLKVFVLACCVAQIGHLPLFSIPTSHIS